MFFQQNGKERQTLKRKLPENIRGNKVSHPTNEDSSKSAGPSPKRIDFDREHAYNIKPSASPIKVHRNMHERLDRSNDKIYKLQRKLKTAQQKLRRYKGKVDTLNAVVKRLKQEQLISLSCEEMLNKSFTGVPLDLMKRMTSGKQKGFKYTPELMAFALKGYIAPNFVVLIKFLIM